MNQQAPPQTAGPRRQSLSRKTIHGSAFLAISVLLSTLIGPAAIGVILIGVVAVLCSQSSLEYTEMSLVKPTRLDTFSKL